MLNWFAKRLQELQKAKRDEKGFTHRAVGARDIIGILAAIAIPAFLSQRTRAQEGAAKSDLRNAAAAATSCFSKNDGSDLTPTSCTEQELKDNHGFNESAQVNVTVATPTADVCSATSKHANAPTSFSYSSTTGTISPVTLALS